MLRWDDEAVVLSVRPWGETSAVAQLLTRDHGRHAGLVKGAMAPRSRAAFHPGNRVRASFSARLGEHLGTFACELVEARAARVLDSPGRLHALASVCALAESLLAEREPARAVHDASDAVIDAIAAGRGWPEAYVRWEVELLRETGAGLDLAACALTGAGEGLAYVSPNTGRAVSRTAAAPWVRTGKLLALPAFLAGGGEATPAEVLAGFELAGHFLLRHAQAMGRRSLPPPRERLGAALRRRAGADGGGGAR